MKVWTARQVMQIRPRRDCTKRRICISFDPNFSYCILQYATVLSAISSCLVCKQCGSEVKFLQASVRGLRFKLHIECVLHVCDKDINRVYSPPLIETAYEINRRFAFVMCVHGTELQGMHLFCSLMDLPRFVSQKSFDAIADNIHTAI